MKTVGLISPGEMGASVGAAAISKTAVIWAGGGRSAESHDRATSAGLSDCGTLEQMTKTAEIILSVCPPHNAASVAKEISSLGYEGLFVDCNAVSPQKTRQLSEHFDPGSFVDGGIVGGPAWKAASGTCLYLSGKNAAMISSLFEDSPLQTNIISEEIGAASAMKMAFAAYTKGSIALLAAILGVAEKQGVRDVLEAQWGDAFTDKTHAQLVNSAVKAWRFSGEMHEIADTFAESGFPDGFHRSAADIYERLAGFKGHGPEEITEYLQQLLVPS